MISALFKQWFLISLAVAACIGYQFPEFGQILIHYDILTIGLVLSFFLTGLFLETHVVVSDLNSVKGLTAAIISSLLVYPVVAWLFTSPLGSFELVVGCCIIATAPVTISSGTILTNYAGGNVSFSILLCILTHFLAIFSIPFMLDTLLSTGSTIDLPMLSILLGLVLKVLIPLIVGQITRPLVGRSIVRFTTQASVFQSCLILLMVAAAVSGSVESLQKMNAFMAVIVGVVIVLHLFMLLFNYVLARLIRVDPGSLIVLTIHAPQKTLGVSYIVWAGFFAADYPGAFVPAIVCHLAQMISGTLIAELFRKNSLAQETISAQVERGKSK